MTAALPIVRTDVAAPRGEPSVALLEQLYPDIPIRIHRGAGDLSVRTSRRQVGGLSLDSLQATAEYDVQIAAPHDLMIMHVREGRVRVDDGRDQIDATPGQAFVYRRGSHPQLRVDGRAVRVVQLSHTYAGTVAEETMGLPAADLRIEGMRPVSPALNSYWEQVLGLLTAQLTTPRATEIEPLVADQLLRLVASAVLAIFPNTSQRDAPRTSAGHIPPASIRRAVEYLEAHVGESLTVADIAEQCGLSLRALHYGFRHHLDATPSEYLRRVRLTRAHADLQAADPTTGVTVAQIAARWGFANAGHFAARYAAAYQQRPSQTLRT